MMTTINGLPPEPGEIYYGPGTILPLLDRFGAVVGEIEEVEHKIHRRIVCPCDCRPLMLAQDPDTFSMLVPGTGGGATYDWIQGLLATSGDINPPSVFCAAGGGGPVLTVPGTPALGQAIYLLARDKFDGFVGSYGDCDPVPMNLDLLFGAVCPP
jgi:hypothetical protein